MLNIPSAIIADDDLVFTLIIRRFLNELGFKVLAEAHTEDEVVSVCSAEKPDFIILDVHLEKGNGLKARRRIREFSDVPILMLSGSSPNVIPDLKGFDYLEKPFLVTEFNDKITQMLGVYQQQASI